ncbi:unnamed protein product [Heterobilharzia americana]|nr:unnamed protein product [Heterobilharzia americana]
MASALCQLDENLLAKLESSKWQERKEVLELISNQLKVSNLSSGLCSVLTKALCQVISSDKHSMLVIRASGVLCELIESVGSGFSVHAERALSTCLLKIKETKANLAQTLRSTTTAIVDTMPFDMALLQLQNALTTPVAKIQAEALRLLTHIFCKSNPKNQLQLSQRLKIVKPLLSNVVQFSEHRSPECRDACFEMLAAIRIFLDFSSQQFVSITDKMLDDTRRSKVDIAFLQLSESIFSREYVKNTNTNSVSKSKSLSAKQQLINDSDFVLTPIKSSDKTANTFSKTGKQPLREISKNQKQSHLSTSTPFSDIQKVKSRTPKQNDKISTPVCTLPKIPSSHKREQSKQPPVMGKTRAQSKKKEKYLPRDLNLSPDQLRIRLSETYLENISLEQITDSSWKIRLQCTECIHSVINSNPPKYPDVQYLLQFMVNSGTVKDNIFRVRCEALNILSKLLSKNKSRNWIPTQLLETLCDQLFTTVSDSKSGPLVEQTLRHLLNIVNFSEIVECINTSLRKHTSPSVHASLIKWLSSAVRSLDDSSFDHLLPIEIVKFGLASSTANVRSAAVEFAGVIYSRLRSSVNIRSFFASEKPAMLQRLESEFAVYDTLEESNTSQSSRKNEQSTFSGMENVTPAAVEAWSNKQKRMTTVMGPISPSLGLVNAQGVLQFSDSDESSVLERSSVPYRKGVIEALTRQPPQTVDDKCNQTCQVAQTTSSLTYDTLFFVESNDETSLLQTKESRLENLKKYKENISKDELRHLFDECHTHPSLMKHLFSTSYEAYLEALDRLIASFDDNDKSKIPSPHIVTYAHFDLIVIWIVEYCFGSWLKDNIQQSEYQNIKAVLTRAFEYLTAVISLFAQNDLRLSQHEVNIILIPLLKCQLQSLSVYKDSTIYRAASDLVHLIRQVYPASLLMDTLAKYMHQCDTAKMREICLNELLSIIPRLLADSDPGVKKSALNCLHAAYNFLGPSFWQHIGNLPERDKKSLEQYLSSEPQLTSPTLDNFEGFETETPSKSCVIKNAQLSASHTRSLVRTDRPASPPPLHMSPAEPSYLLPLITARDNPFATESERISASSQLNAALSCLVDQLGGCVPDYPDLVKNIVPDDKDCIDENEDRSCFNNVVLGALIDLEVLIRDSKTRDLLPPFMPKIITQLTLLCNHLYQSEANAGQAIFLDCLSGELICIFTQPFLFREVTTDNLKYLLGSLIQLAERVQLNREQSLVSPSPRVLFTLKVVRFIYAAVDPSIALSVLLRLVHICCFGCDIISCHRSKLTDFDDDSLTEATYYLDEPFSVEMKPVSFTKVAHLSLAQLSCQISEIRDYINKIDWALILPLLEPFIPNSSGVTKSVKIQSHHSIRVKILQKTVKIIQCMLIEVYACIGQQFLDEVKKYEDRYPSLLHIVEKLKSIMLDAPYPHCRTESYKVEV